MNELLARLLKLQSIQFGEIKEKNSEAAIAKLRGEIPPPILGHYDRLVARGKKGVAMVRDQVCAGCHMRLTMGVIMNLRHGTDVQLCDSCGRYLCLSDASAVPTSEPELTAKPAKKPRKSKRALNPA
jgi:predicted  nucleic acid-binding Zn-ribbon protein